MKKGFTLIELLVVVLIIGILAAIAVPQYETAVKKSRLSTVMSNVKLLKDALELYYLNMGEYPDDDVSGLDFTINGCTSSGGTITCAKEVYDYWYSGSNIIGGFPKDQGIGYAQYPSRDALVAKRGIQECWAEPGNKTSIQVCESMGGVRNGSNGWRATSAGAWQVYTLP